MDESELWRAIDVGMGQVVHVRVPYPIGVCKAPASPCPIPVSANQVSMNPVVAPGRDAALMEFEEDSSDFFFEQDSGDDVDSFPVVHWASSVVKSHAPVPPLSEGDEAEVKPSQGEVCDIVPPLVVWEELFNASEAYFADGLSSMGVVQEGEGEDSGRVVEPSGVSAAEECGSVWSAMLGRLSAVLWGFATIGGCLVILVFALLLFSSLFLLGGRGA